MSPSGKVLVIWGVTRTPMLPLSNFLECFGLDVGVGVGSVV